MATSSKVRPRHLTRKELKQPDDFMVAAGRVRDFAEQHLWKLLAATVAVCVIALAIFAYHRHRVSVAEQASQQFYDGFQAFNAKDYKTAERRFLGVMTEYSGSEPAHLATFYSGLAYLAQKNWPQAIEMLSNYTSENGDRFLRQLALFDLGVAYEASGDLAQAAQNYSAAASIDGPASVNAKLAVAHLFELQGKRHDAIVTYQQLLADPQASGQREQVMAALARLMGQPAASASAVSAQPAAPAPASAGHKPAVQPNAAPSPASKAANH